MNVTLTDEDRIPIDNPADLYDIMRRILLRENRIDREKEHFWMVGLNQRGVILYIELISMGSAKATIVEPMNVYRVAILKGATRVIAVHNHPSGTLRPSDEDKNLTNRLIQVGIILDIIMEDHLIITPSDFVSFRGIGLIDELIKSTRFVPPYVLAERMKKEAEEMIKKETEEILNNMVNVGLSTEEISKILKISIEEVEEAIEQHTL